MAFLCGRRDDGDDEQIPDETEIDEQPTRPLPAAALEIDDPQALIETWPKLPSVDLAVLAARKAYWRQEEKVASTFCPVCLRFDGVEDGLAPQELTNKIRPRLCAVHEARSVDGEPWQRFLAHVIVRQSISWYLWPPGLGDFE